MYLLTGCLCGEDPAARSRPPCRAEGFQAESRVAGAGGMCAPAPAVFGSAPARGPLSMQKNALSPATPFHRERETRLSPTAPSRRSAPGSGAQAGLPGEDCQTAVDGRGVSRRKCLWGSGICPFPTAPPRWETPSDGTTPGREIPSSGTRSNFARGKTAKWRLAKSGVKAQTPSGTGKPLALDGPALPGNSQQRHTARFCQGQNRQTVIGKERCQSASAAGHRETAHSQTHRLAGALPAAGHGPVLPRAKSPNGVWRKAVSKLKRFRRLSGARAPCSRRGGPGRWTAPAGRSRPPPPSRPGGG